MRMICNSCRGEYDDVGPDGVLYFHACAPIIRARVRRADGTTAVVDPANVRQDDARIGDVVEERPDKRDENTARRDGDDPRQRVIRSEGKGATPKAGR